MARSTVRQLPARQRVRRALLLISLLAFPITLYYQPQESQPCPTFTSSSAPARLAAPSSMNWCAAANACASSVGPGKWPRPHRGSNWLPATCTIRPPCAG